MQPPRGTGTAPAPPCSGTPSPYSTDLYLPCSRLFSLSLYIHLSLSLSASLRCPANSGRSPFRDCSSGGIWLYIYTYVSLFLSPHYCAVCLTHIYIRFSLSLSTLLHSLAILGVFQLLVSWNLAIPCIHTYI